MGVSCRVLLPANVRIKDVVAVIAASAGYRPTRQDFGGRNQGWYTKVDGVTIKPQFDGSYATIEFDGRFVIYNFECSTEPGKRQLNPTSTAFWGAIGKRLVDFFGGKIDYDDSDDVDWDYEAPEKSNLENSPSDGDEWYDLQKRLLEVKPLIEAELESIDGVAFPWDSEKAQRKYTFDEDGYMIRTATKKAA